MHSFLSVVRNLHTLAIFKQLREKNRRFDAFRERIKLTERHFQLPQELDLVADSYDYYICGSDQIWNPQCLDFDPSYLLDFVRDKRKCISYASSIAVQELPEEWEETFAKTLKNYRALSVRERRGCEIISSLVKRQVEWVVDPVFLFSSAFWKQEVKVSNFNKPYVCCYFIGDVPGMRNYSINISKRLSAMRVLLNKNLRDLGKPGKRMYSAGPQEFLGLISRAKCICTNSFHAVAFSLIFRKDFWVFDDAENPSSDSSRIRDILSLVGLEDRILSSSSMGCVDSTQQIDYSKVRLDLLEEHIEKSKKFLREALLG